VILEKISICVAIICDLKHLFVIVFPELTAKKSVRENENLFRKSDFQKRFEMALPGEICFKHEPVDQETGLVSATCLSEQVFLWVRKFIIQNWNVAATGACSVLMV